MSTDTATDDTATDDPATDGTDATTGDAVLVADAHDDHHWTDLQFVYLAIGLAIITAIEVALSYMVDYLGPLFLPLLLILMLIKFFSVVLYFMHLKFDNRWFSAMFYMGLIVAVGVYIAALATFHFFSN